jgi:hypothetical protein
LFESLYTYARWDQLFKTSLFRYKQRIYENMGFKKKF